MTLDLWLAALCALGLLAYLVAVLIRPDHNVFGTGTAAALLARRAELLGLKLETAA